MRIPVRIGAALLCAAVALGAGRVDAQEAYPTRPLLLTHGFGAGGNGDVISRIVAEPLAAKLGQPVIVEPRPGAGGNTASARLVKSAPDGYTLISLTGGHAVSAAIYKSLPFDPVDDFQMLSIYGFQAFLIAVRQDSPIKTLADLIAAAKASPGKLTYSSVGVGSTQHLAGELLCAMAGIQMTHIPYRGGSAPMTDLLGGQIDVAVDSITVIEPQLTAGSVRALAVTSPARWWSLPQIAPVADTVPGYNVQTWLGMATAKGVPQPIVQRLVDDLHAVLDLPATRERLRQVGMDVRPGSPDEMRTLIAGEIAKWRKVVADAHIPQQ